MQASFSRRVLLGGVTALAILSTACSEGPGDGQRGAPVDAASRLPLAREAAVIEVIAQHWIRPGGNYDHLGLDREYLDGSGVSMEDWLPEEIGDELPGVSAEDWATFRSELLHGEGGPAPAPSNPRLRVLTEDESAAVVRAKMTRERGKSDSSPCAGLVSTSRPVLVGSDLALIYVDFWCGPLCGNGTIALLRFLDGRWTLVEELGLWTS